MSAWWARNRLLVVIAGVVVLAVVILFLTGRPSHSKAFLEPGNPDPLGAQAVARVLPEHGVTTDVVRSERGFAGAPVDVRTTVVVTSADQLGNATSRELARRAAAAGHVVLVDPQPATLRAFGLPLTRELLAGTTGACGLPLLTGLRPDVSGAVGYRTTPLTARGCFAGTRGDGFSAIVAYGHVVVVGIPDVFANESITKGDNAAVALRLLGQGDRLVWYVPDASDIPYGDGGSVSSLLPRWLRPGLLILLGASLALVFWRGRRLGPVVVEPLPVVVRAVETAQSRGRLYRRARDRSHAASILRRRTVARLAAALRLPRGADADTVAVTVSARTSRPLDDVHALLLPSSVTDDAGLTRLVSGLDRLEKEVLHP